MYTRLSEMDAIMADLKWKSVYVAWYSLLFYYVQFGCIAKERLFLEDYGSIVIDLEMDDVYGRIWRIMDYASERFYYRHDVRTHRAGLHISNFAELFKVGINFQVSG